MNSSRRDEKRNCISENMKSETDRVKEEVTALFANSLDVLNAIWDELGLFGEAKTDRLRSVQKHVADLLRGMVLEEQGNKEVIIQKIEKFLKESGNLQKELGIKLQQTRLVNAPLYQVEKGIRDEVEELRKIRDMRLERLFQLQQKEEELRHILGLRQISPLPNSIPTEDQLANLQKYVEEKEAEQVRLLQQLEDSRQAMQLICNQLGWEPQLDFEKEVLFDSPLKTFRLTPKNMSRVKEMHQLLEQKLADAKESATELREKLSYLWERLQESPEVREAFLEAHPGYSYSTISALKEELKRCEALKSANIKVFIKQLRDELVSWWDRCRYSSDQRAAFSLFYSDVYTEDLLELHELEVEKLRQFYEKHRDVYQLVGEFDKLWEKMQELEARANNPNRLFQNRGGQLLREEKERKTIQKELPKILKVLMDHLNAYEAECNEPFLIDGEDIASKIRQMWDDREENKEMLKMHRKVTRETQLEVESRMGSKLTPGKLKCPGATNTPSMISRPQRDAGVRSAPARAVAASLKRKAPNTPQSSVSNLRKRNKKSSEKKSPLSVSRSGLRAARRSGQRSGPRYSTSKIRRFGKNAPRNLNTTHDLQPVKSRRNILVNIPDDSILSGLTSYTEFQDQLEVMNAEKVCRSSVMPQHCLKDRNTPNTPPHTQPSATKLVMTPGRITSSQLTLTPGGKSTGLNTPIKPPRRNAASGIPTPVQNLPVRTSTRLNLRSPGYKSPGGSSGARLTTPRGRLPIII